MSLVPLPRKPAGAPRQSHVIASLYIRNTDRNNISKYQCENGGNDRVSARDGTKNHDLFDTRRGGGNDIYKCRRVDNWTSIKTEDNRSDRIKIYKVKKY